ncbi:MAG: sigma-70 family RNA polymerase sigma factor [Gemmatales bacterium]|nr:sigma-70 family RNA polymerase sigma factor [Gemmatales bacterium]MCS7161454.1 sigma-70 family RNA polymerase sigma factor [Gemmatales bacterium]MDW8176657.1 sigma-70 family RNA polymerase sigma factor [Gemmatales bacterium]MDW8221882.1 sigma-70 family RNA polymerase sigma factor [Gemmatales bacterium]
MVEKFRNELLRQLYDQTVRYAPVERKLEQLSRAERLLTEIEHQRTYPYQYVCYRLTGFRPDSHVDEMITGEDLEHDLSLFIAMLSESVPAVPVEQMPEPVLNLEQVRRRLRVSARTLSHLRQHGLVSRKVLCGGRQRVVVRQSVLDHYLQQHGKPTAESLRLGQIQPAERERILRWARRMAQVAPDRADEIFRRLARRFGRRVQAIRALIRAHDQANPEQAIFPGLHGPLDEHAKRAIYTSYTQGISVERLAKVYHRTRTTIQRVLNEQRARTLLAKPITYIHSPEFEDPKREAEILAPMPGASEYEQDSAAMRGNVPRNLPPELAPLYQVPLLKPEQERHLFRQMNYLKYKAARLAERIDPAKAKTADLDKLEELLTRAHNVRKMLIAANMRLVASITKRYAERLGHPGAFFDLFGDGNMSLIRAVDKFDYMRGNKFSTYATWAIRKNFTRSIPAEQIHRERFITGLEEMFESAEDMRSDEFGQLSQANLIHEKVKKSLERLDERERRIIQLRVGLGENKGMTLEEVGRELGITKERVRQLEARGMAKLRAMLQGEEVES